MAHKGLGEMLRSLIWTNILLVALFSLAAPVLARDAVYDGSEIKVYVTPGEPTLLEFPAKIESGVKRGNSSLTLERKENRLIVFARANLPLTGEALLILLHDKRSYSLRMLPSSPEFPRDTQLNITDNRVPEYAAGKVETPVEERRVETSPKSPISALLRDMVRVAEFGRKAGISGYRRTNSYSGEEILNDGTIKGTIKEMFIGGSLTGYVLTVENLLDTTVQLNAGTFRLDGTRMVSASRWELAPRPQTMEQKVSNKHVSTVYIVTRSPR